MPKHSKHEREQRARETERIREIESAWVASVPTAVAREFAMRVEAARNRAPEPRRSDMAPGTLPNPPRPGREPRAVKEPAQRRGRR